MEAIHRGYEMPLREALLLEASLFGLCFGTQDRREGNPCLSRKEKTSVCGPIKQDFIFVLRALNFRF